MDTPATSTLASPATHTTVIATDGARLSLRAYGPTNAPRLVVGHGNGMAVDGYRLFWEPLTDAFQVVALDMRSHGRSEGGAAERHTWSQFADDFEVIWQALPRWLGERTTIGVFHSLSAVASLAHLERCGPRCDALLLFDPPLAPPEGHPLAALHHANMMELANGARARNAVFASPSRLAEKFARQSAFERWQPEAYAAMANATLVHEPDGTWRLACPPALEAVIYETNIDASLWSTVRRASVPIKIVGGDPTLPGAPASVKMACAAGTELAVPYEAVAGTTHFLQLERPEACRSLMRTFAGQQEGRTRDVAIGHA